MNKIPTAEEYFDIKCKERGINHMDELVEEDIAIILNGYAKLHLEAAMEAIKYVHKQLRISPVKFKELHGYRPLTEVIEIEKKIITDSYPLTNIK